jgi:hypothetical protein
MRVKGVVPRRAGIGVQHRLQGGENPGLVEGILVAGAVRLRNRKVDHELLVVGPGTVSHLDPE